MKNMINKNLLKEYEKKGLVADSQALRMSLIDEIFKNKATLQQTQQKLKDIIKTAHAKGLYVREDFFKKSLPDEQVMLERRVFHSKKQLEVNLEDKDYKKATKL